ncbi:OmpA family protein [Sphaerotilus microaerophilus]|jgi:outer membrane protein OmpA-like peptidoglycan-associated protein|uniref:OmpA family protein n=1 Tax=Sphaerotilus microaerophilus TaxID=2914710 RepID=UPI0020744F4E|nr:OmpA family protein [Sphaerotilus sp. FB-5]
MRLLDATSSFSLRPTLVRRAVLLGLTAAGLTAAAGAADLSNRGSQTDGSVAADHQGYQKQQEAIRALNATGKQPLRSYSIAKAQCWLDVSFHEYTRNDRSAFPQEALRQSEAITSYLASGANPRDAANPAFQTPLVNDALKLRDDLWTTTGALKKGAGWACVQQQVACAEVELVHAGNEQNQQGWRHAKPYVQIAEDLVGAASAGALSCDQPDPLDFETGAGRRAEPPAPPPPPPPPAPVPPPPPVVKETIILGASVLFAFDRRSEADLLPGGRGQLDQLVTRLNKVYERVDQIELVGYTDRLGTEAYNAQLSQDRADVIKAYLERKGVTTKITAAGKGSADPVVQCPGQRQTPQLTDCLQPNRRVEIGITGVKR